MKAGIVRRPRNAVVFIGIIGALKIYIVPDHGFDHFNTVLKMHIIISCTMNDEKLSLNSVRKI